MDIAALSTQLTQASVMQQVSLAVAEMAIDVQTDMATQLVESVETNAPHPTLGQSIDLSI